MLYQLTSFRGENSWFPNTFSSSTAAEARYYWITSPHVLISSSEQNEKLTARIMALLPGNSDIQNPHPHPQIVWF